MQDEIGPFRIALPVSGLYGRDWVISKYVDQNHYGEHDPSAGPRDYMGGRRTYCKHEGTDFLVPNFRSMDSDRVVIRAAAAGEVLCSLDKFFDRVVADEVGEVVNDPQLQKRCNKVIIRHANNYQTTYLHMKQGSARVKEGDRVVAGDPLGIIGSSGPSTDPHLHFGVCDDTGRVVEPFECGLWYAPPAYDSPLGLLDYCVLSPDPGEWVLNAYVDDANLHVNHKLKVE